MKHLAITLVIGAMGICTMLTPQVATAERRQSTADLVTAEEQEAQALEQCQQQFLNDLDNQIQNFSLIHLPGLLICKLGCLSKILNAEELGACGRLCDVIYQ